MPSISYAITVCNEHKELERLGKILLPFLREEDELVIQADEKNTTVEVQRVMKQLANSGNNVYSNVKLTFYPLNKDFSAYKNNLKRCCTKDYIFQIDADEYPSEELLTALPEILELNPSVELYAVPRINTVEGLTQEHILKWRWYVNENGWVNYPDYQTRILKNTSEIGWVNKVHERIVGAREASYLPEGYDLIHPKTIERQEKQNELYSTL